MREKLAVVGERLAGMAVVWRFLWDSRARRERFIIVTPDSCLTAMHRGCILVVAVCGDGVTRAGETGKAQVGRDGNMLARAGG